MRPFPKILQELFPCALGRIPERPWWRVGVGIYSVRNDGARISFVAPEEKDAVSPLPFPGVRPGQIWADENGNTARVTHEKFPGEVKEIEARLKGLGYVFLLADPICPHLAPWAPSENQ